MKITRCFSFVPLILLGALLFPINVFATSSELKINGVEIAPESYGDVLGDGTVTYNPSSHSLTMNAENVHTIETTCTERVFISITDYMDNGGSSGLMISAAGPLDISFSGNGGLAVFEGGGNAQISSHGDLNITTSVTTQDPINIDPGFSITFSAGGGNITITATSARERLISGATESNIYFSNAHNICINDKSNTGTFCGHVYIDAENSVSIANPNGSMCDSSFSVNAASVHVSAFKNNNAIFFGNTTINASQSYLVKNESESGWLMYNNRTFNSATYPNSVRELTYTAPPVEGTTGVYYAPLVDEINDAIAAQIAMQSEERKETSSNVREDTIIHYSVGDSLPNEVMKTLGKAEHLSLLFSFTYEGIDHTVLIKSTDAEDNDIAWYGPLYLLARYGEYDPAKSLTGTYEVLAGESLNIIAKKLGISTEELIEKNPQIKNRNLIYPGDKLNY